MRTVYRDSDYKCYPTNDGTKTPFETDFFDGKCDTAVEGYRILLEGETWTREDGEVFTGPMISPWKPDTELAAAQAQYEADNAALTEAYQEGVNSV